MLLFSLCQKEKGRSFSLSCSHSCKIFRTFSERRPFLGFLRGLISLLSSQNWVKYCISTSSASSSCLATASRSCFAKCSATSLDSSATFVCNAIKPVGDFFQSSICGYRPVCPSINACLFSLFPSVATRKPILYLGEASFSRTFCVAELLLDTT